MINVLQWLLSCFVQLKSVLFNLLCVLDHLSRRQKNSKHTKNSKINYLTEREKEVRSQLSFTITFKNLAISIEFLQPKTEMYVGIVEYLPFLKKS